MRGTPKCRLPHVTRRLDCGIMRRSRRTAFCQVHTHPSLQIRNPSKPNHQRKNKQKMSRRTTTIEEEFDDDTNLPLPNRALPNTGTRGAILEEIGFDSDREVDEDNGDEDDDPDLMELTTQSSATGSASRQEGSNSIDRPVVTDIKPYKS